MLGNGFGWRHASSRVMSQRGTVFWITPEDPEMARFRSLDDAFGSGHLTERTASWLSNLGCLLSGGGERMSLHRPRRHRRKSTSGLSIPLPALARSFRRVRNRIWRLNMGVKVVATTVLA